MPPTPTGWKLGASGREVESYAVTGGNFGPEEASAETDATILQCLA